MTALILLAALLVLAPGSTHADELPGTQQTTPSLHLVSTQQKLRQMQMDQNQRRFAPFTLKAFISGLKNKKSFIVFSADDINPISAKQEPALAILLREPELKDYTFYRLDYVTQKLEAEKIYVNAPGMIMIYRDGKEVSRTRNVVGLDRLSALLIPKAGDTALMPPMSKQPPPQAEAQPTAPIVPQATPTPVTPPSTPIDGSPTPVQ